MLIYLFKWEFEKKIERYFHPFNFIWRCNRPAPYFCRQKTGWRYNRPAPYFFFPCEIAILTRWK